MSEFERPRPIVASDDFSDFDCGESTLNDWLRRRALRNERQRASRTFVSVERHSGLVTGYYCLSSSALRMADATGRLRRNMPDPIPVLLIGRLAVDNRFAGQGLGTSLLRDVLTKSIEVGRTIGVRAVVVVALSDEAESFYAKWGFARMPESQRAMYLLMEDAERTVIDL